MPNSDDIDDIQTDEVESKTLKKLKITIDDIKHQKLDLQRISADISRIVRNIDTLNYEFNHMSNVIQKRNNIKTIEDMYNFLISKA
jgi:hypothetical protein